MMRSIVYCSLTLLLFWVSLVRSNDLQGFHRCADPVCSVLIAKGRTTNKYISGAYGLLSFSLGQDVLIYSKEGRDNKMYWSVEINGKRGFAPKMYITVTNELVRELQYELPLSGKYQDSNSQQQQQQQPQQQPQPNNEKVEQVPSIPMPTQGALPHPPKNNAPNTHQEPPQIIPSATATPAPAPALQPQASSSEATTTSTTTPLPAPQTTSPNSESHIVETTVKKDISPSVLSQEAEAASTEAPLLSGTPLDHEQKEQKGMESMVPSLEMESTTPSPTTPESESEIPTTTTARHEDVVHDSQSSPPQDSPPVKEEQPVGTPPNEPEVMTTPAEEVVSDPESVPTEVPVLLSDANNMESDHNESLSSEPPLEESVDFESDGFYKNEEEELDYVDEDESTHQNEDDKKEIVSQVIEDFKSSPQPEDAPSSSGFHYANQIKPEEESKSLENSEDNHHHIPPPEMPGQEASPERHEETEENQTYEHQSLSQKVCFRPRTYYYNYDAPQTGTSYTADYLSGGAVPHLPQGSEESVNESAGPNNAAAPDIDDVRKPIFGEPQSDSAEATMNIFDRLIQDIYPSWVHDVIHVNGFEEVSPEYTLCMLLSASTICIIYCIKFIMEKTSRESPLKARVALLDKQLFQSKNDNLITKKQLESSNNTSADSNSKAVTSPKTIIKQETPSHILAELEQLKEEREKLLNDSYNYQLIVQEKSSLEEEKDKYKSLYDQSQLELLEAETIVQECLEEKKSAKVSSSNNEDMLKALQTLEDQLNSQKQAVMKYESKVKKRDSELKEKIQELRKLRADAANAKLETDRVGAEKEGLLKRIQALEGIDKERESELEKLRSSEKDLKALKTKLGELKEDFESKESELEAKNTEIEVLNNTIGTLKCIASASESENQTSDGWDFQETPSIDVIEELSRCKVDLKKASNACDNLSEQLTKTESERDELQSTLTKEKDECEVALKVKEHVLREKVELEHKHSVLSNYFNQREAELQKQLGLQSARLNTAEMGTESSSKKMVSVCEELESYKSQLKTLKLEMEEMERSWKSQNASLEKKQHESWVTVRQEARRNAEAQNEMQTLRSKLTVTEAKILEKETEIKRVSDENRALRETIQNISSQPLNSLIKPEPSNKGKSVSFEEQNCDDNNKGTQENSVDNPNVYPNGHSLSVLPNSNGKSSGSPSVSSLEPPPPELPPLPFLPPTLLPMMPMLPPHNSQSIMDTHRPPPVGRRSPTRGGNGGGGRYSRSPSPPGGGYYNNNNSSRFRDSSPGSRSDRSRFDYSPSPPYNRRHSSRERSPDRFSTRSDRSDLSHHHHQRHRGDNSYRDTPPRDPRHHHHQYHHQHTRRSSNEFPGSGLDDDDEENYHRSKRTNINNSNRHRNSTKNSRNKNGPKTSSPLVDGRDLNI